MSGLSGDLWPLHPHRLSDELLSFWVLRIAHANRIKLQTFTNATFGRNASPWNRDIDRSAGDAFLKLLSVRTGATVDELRGGMLSSYEGILFEHHNPQGNTHWILPLGIYHRTRRAYGVQFCPTCLFWDPIPYFRRRWRLALSTICDRHGSLLHDRCTECGAPVIYFRNDLGLRKYGRLGNHTLCWHCGFDYRRAPVYAADWLDAETYIALRSLLTFIDDGIAVAGLHYHQYAHLWLQVLHRLCEILASSGRSRRSDKLQTVVSQATRLALPLAAGAAKFESFGLHDRHRLLLSALWMLMDYPGRFIRICREAGLRRSLVLGDLCEVPYWFDRLLKQELDGSRYVPNVEEVRQAANYLIREGKAITQTSVQQVIGRGGDQATSIYKMERRSPWPRNHAEFDRVLALLAIRIKSLEIGGVRRLLAERDWVIFLMMKTTGWSASKVLGITLDEIKPMLAPGSAALPSVLKGHLVWYLITTRRALVGGKPRAAFFVGSTEDGIGVENLAQKARRLRGSHQ